MSELPTIDHAGQLADLSVLPGSLTPMHQAGPASGLYSCAFCGVGDSGRVVTAPTSRRSGDLAVEVDGTCTLSSGLQLPARIDRRGHLRVQTTRVIAEPGQVQSLRFTPSGQAPRTLAAREIDREEGADGLVAQSFAVFRRAVSVTDSAIENAEPTSGCVKLRLSTHRARGAFPIHVAPTVKTEDGRQTLSYAQAIERMADLFLRHRPNLGARTLVYCCGQIDYFTIFAMQEVFRLLGIRNLTGNAEHCLNAGAVHNEVLTGQEGPFLTIDQSINGDNRFFLFNGWNGFVTHPPAFHQITKRKDFDAFLIEVQVTESAKAVAKKLGPDRVLLIRPRSDPQLALAVANEIFTHYADAIDQRFIDAFADARSFEAFRRRARSPRFKCGRVAKRIAPEEKYVDRLVKGIRTIAAKLAQPGSVPINIPSVGLSQTSGIVAHCVWGDILAMLGKYGLRPGGEPAGGTLRIPGQINAESEVQGLSRKYFFGRVRMDRADDIARRMGLPDDAYAMCVDDVPRAALDYSEPTDEPELMVFFGTQFEANMMGRPRWLAKLADPNVKMIVVDPLPDHYAVENAELIVPSPPHPATTKLYQNGEWKLSLSVPQKRAPAETRSDATIIYDLMAEITRRLDDPEVRAAHPDLARHKDSGYLQRRFCPPTSDVALDGLTRVDGEVSRPELWDRIQSYMVGGSGPLYCHPTHADGRPIRWPELLRAGSMIYGGVGTTRFVLDYDKPDHHPFRDVFCKPRRFEFFVPTHDDIEMPDGVILNSGRSSLSDDRKRVLFATSSFNSGKATPIVGMPETNPLFVSPSLATQTGLRTGDRARVTNRTSGAEMTFPVEVSDRVKGTTCYVSFHKSRAKMETGECVNEVTTHIDRCSYSGQTQVKCTQIVLERVTPECAAVDTSWLDPTAELPTWNGKQTPLVVVEILQETHDVTTYRFQGKTLCRFQYLPGQFCTLHLEIDGKPVKRSYTISSTPTRPFNLEITVKRVPGGLVSNWLPDNVRVGDEIIVDGPRGSFCMRPGEIPKKVLLIGAGSGVTPCMSMARYLYDLAADVDVQFLNCVRSPDDIIYDTEINMITSRSQNFAPVLIAASRGSGDWSGLCGRINTQMLQQSVPDLAERTIYMCGPAGFMDAVRNILGELGYDMAKLHTESFGGGPRPVVVPAANARAVEIEFAGAGKAVVSDGATPLLDVAEDHDIEIDYSCRSGSCGDCRCRLLSGTVSMEGADALTDEERDEGWVLTCIAVPTSDVVLDV